MALESLLRPICSACLVGGDPEILMHPHILGHSLPIFQADQFPPNRLLNDSNLVFIRALSPHLADFWRWRQAMLAWVRAHQMVFGRERRDRGEALVRRGRITEQVVAQLAGP